MICVITGLRVSWPGQWTLPRSEVVALAPSFTAAVARDGHGFARDRSGAATTYHQLGVVGQEQRRFEEAEGHYRQALTILLEFTHSQLGTLLTNTNQLESATEHSPQALVLRLDTTQVWSPVDLSRLKRQCRLLGPTRFDELTRATAPVTVAEALPTRLESATEPDEPPASGPAPP